MLIVNKPIFAFGRYLVCGVRITVLVSPSVVRSKAKIEQSPHGDSGSDVCVPGLPHLLLEEICANRGFANLNTPSIFVVAYRETCVETSRASTLALEIAAPFGPLTFPVRPEKACDCCATSGVRVVHT